MVWEKIQELMARIRTQADPGAGLLQLGLNLVNGELGLEAKIYSHLVFQEAAEVYGSGQAMYELGMCYRWGDGGVYADPEEAIAWLKKAAKKGAANAKALVKQFDSPAGKSILLMSAMNSAQGQGSCWYRAKVGVDYYYAQADAGNAESQYELARQLANPNHYGPFRYDIAKAIHYYTLAAEQGVVDAMFNLGQLYLQGSPGMEPDREQAKAWFTRCADTGDQEAKQILLGL